MGDEVLKSDRETYLELVKLFPERANRAILDAVEPARMFLKRYEAEALSRIGV